MAEPKLHIELIDRLRDASAAMHEAMSVVGDTYGSDDEMLDKLSEASALAAAAADRLQELADTYGEMVHLGI